MRWRRTKDRFGDTVYTSGEYRIERFTGLGGARHVFALSGPAGEHNKTTLRAAQWEAERHARRAQLSGTPSVVTK